MFDKTISLTSTDKSVTLEITAGTEGVKLITVHGVDFPSYVVSEQELIDLVAPAIKAHYEPPPAAPE